MADPKRSIPLSVARRGAPMLKHVQALASRGILPAIGLILTGAVLLAAPGDPVHISAISPTVEVPSVVPTTSGVYRPRSLVGASMAEIVADVVHYTQTMYPSLGDHAQVRLVRPV